MVYEQLHPPSVRLFRILLYKLDKNKTNYPISSYSHPSATADKAIHSLKIGEGLQNQREHHMILTKHEAVDPTNVNYKILYSTFDKQSFSQHLQCLFQFSILKCLTIINSVAHIKLNLYLDMSLLV